MYCEMTSPDGETVLGVLYAAKKYMIPTLEAECKMFLEKKLCPFNVCAVFEQVVDFFQGHFCELLGSLYPRYH